MRKYTISILITLMLMLCLTACSAHTEKTPEAAAPEIFHFEPLTAITEGQKNIYLILKVIDSNYWQVIRNGAKVAGMDKGCNIYYGGTTIETDWDGQHVLINEALSQNPDAIILAPDDSTELTPDIERIHSLGIPIILIDTAANTEAFDMCYMTDNLLAGENAAQEMVSQLFSCGYSAEDEISVGIMVGSSKSLTVNERLAGFYQYWSTHAPRKWSIVPDIMNCGGDIELGKELAADFIKGHPGLNGLYGTNNSPTKALASVIMDGGHTDMILVGFDYSDEIKALLESQDFHASTILQRQYDMGYFSVLSVLDILDGKTPSVRFRDTGVVTVNEESLGNAEIQELLKLQ